MKGTKCHQLTTINCHHSILVPYSFQYHSLIQQQGRNLMDFHELLQICEPFPPLSLFFFRSFLMTHLQVLGLELCAVDLASRLACRMGLSFHNGNRTFTIMEACHNNKHPHSMSCGNTRSEMGWRLVLVLVKATADLWPGQQPRHFASFPFEFSQKIQVNSSFHLRTWEFFQLSETNICFW